MTRCEDGCLFEIQLVTRLGRSKTRFTSGVCWGTGRKLAATAMGIFLISPAALATDLVIHADENATMAMEEVVGLTDRTFEQLYPMTMRDLVAQRTPILQGKGQLYLCYSAPTALAATQDVLERALEAVQYQEYDRATTMLRTAVATLGCLVEPLGPELGARTYLYRGYLELIAEREDLARASFRQAKLYDPNVAWDYLFTTGQEVFDAVSVDTDIAQAASLEVLPPPAVGALYINGVVVDESSGPIQVPAGIHIVQVAMPELLTMTVELRPGEQARLVIPAAVPADGVNWAANEYLRPALGAVFRASVQPDVSVFVVGDKSVWEFDVSEAEWTDTVAAADDRAMTMTAAAEAARRPKQLATYAAVGSAGLAVVSAALLGASGVMGSKAKTADGAYNDALLASDELAAIAAYNDVNQFRSAASGLRAAGAVGLVLAGGGGAFATVSFQLGYSRRKALPAANPYALDVARAAEDSGTAPVKSEE